MTLPQSAHRSNHGVGIALMVTAMLIVPFVDGIAKALSNTHSPLFIAWARYAVASAIVLPVATALHGRNFLPSKRRVSHMLRTVYLITAMTLYFFSIATVPLATAVSAYFIGPIVAVALAIVLLGERITTTKIASVGLGFTGSILVVRPGPGIEPGILLALGAGISFAFYLIATRKASEASDPVKTLAFQCLIGTLLLTPQALFAWSPGWTDLWLFAGLGSLSAISHFLSITAFRFAEASALAPLVYVELIGAALIGYLLFGDMPDVATVAGASMIAVAGLLLVRQRAV